MKNLTLREKIGQMLIIKIQGKEITNETKRMKTMTHMKK